MYHKRVFAAELILKIIPLAFCRGSQGDTNFCVNLQKHVVHAAEDSKMDSFRSGGDADCSTCLTPQKSRLAARAIYPN